MTDIIQASRQYIHIGILAICIFASCGQSKYLSKKEVSQEINNQSGYSIKTDGAPGRFDLPPGVQLADGITETEAVNIALWNNARFQAGLADIEMANAGITNAGIIQNPLLRYLSPTSLLNVSGYINFAIDFIWQRPARIKAARYSADQTRDSVIGRGFGLIRDVQMAYTDVILMKARMDIGEENARIRGELARLAGVRLKYGDISGLEASTVRADSASAADELVTARLASRLALNTLNNLMGVYTPDSATHLTPEHLNAAPIKILPADCLELAFEYRPELRAAKAAISAAGSSLGWERSRIVNFTATLNFQYLSDLQGSQWVPNAANPGLQAEIPVFNRNQGNIQRARAQLERARMDYIAVQQAIALNVAQAYNRYEHAYQSYQIWNGSTIPSLEEAVNLVQQTYQRGDISYLPVLEAMRQLQQAKLRKAEIWAALNRSVSELNFSIGQKLDNPAK